MTLTTKELFEYAKADVDNKYDIKITYVEIYNEVIRDLLVPNSGHLELREDAIKVITYKYYYIKTKHLLNEIIYFNS